MEIRLLESFLAIAEEGSITRAAEVLHITQPALSRQLVSLETELGCTLFVRGRKAMVLTPEGLLLQRRAREITSLVALAADELSDRSADLEGHLSLGAGELSAGRLLVQIVAAFAEEHPRVTFEFFTGVADQVTSRLDRGLLDFGLLLEPVDMARYEYVAMPGEERWVAVVAAGDELVERQVVAPHDLERRVLSVPYRPGVKGLVENWLGPMRKKVVPRYCVNLGGNVARLVEDAGAVAVCVEGCADHWDPSRFSVLPLTPALSSRTALAWKRDVPRTAVAEAFRAFATAQLTTPS